MIQHIIESVPITFDCDVLSEYTIATILFIHILKNKSRVYEAMH